MTPEQIHAAAHLSMTATVLTCALSAVALAGLILAVIAGARIKGKEPAPTAPQHMVVGVAVLGIALLGIAITAQEENKRQEAAASDIVGYYGTTYGLTIDAEDVDRLGEGQESGEVTMEASLSDGETREISFRVEDGDVLPYTVVATDWEILPRLLVAEQ